MFVRELEANGIWLHEPRILEDASMGALVWYRGVLASSVTYLPDDDEEIYWGPLGDYELPDDDVIRPLLRKVYFDLILLEDEDQK